MNVHEWLVAGSRGGSSSLGVDDPSQTYVLQCVADAPGSQLAVALSSNVITLYDMPRLASSAAGPATVKGELRGHTDTIHEISFASKENPSLLVSASKDRTVKLWDTRTMTCTNTVELPPFVKRKEKGLEPYLPVGCASAAIGCDSVLLAASYDHSIAFFDLRTFGKVGAFVESHTQPVSQLRFHPHIPSHLVSSGDDGIVCIFDTAVKGELDALTTVVSVESAVRRFGFFGPHAAFMYCLSRTEDLTLWNLGSAEPAGKFPGLREKLDVLSFVDCVYHPATQRLVVAGSTPTGDLVLADVTPTNVTPSGKLTTGHTSLVRSLHWQAGDSPAFVTGGEDGMVCLWRDGPAPAAPTSAPPVSKAGRGKAHRRAIASPFTKRK